MHHVIGRFTHYMNEKIKSQSDDSGSGGIKTFGELVEKNTASHENVDLFLR